MGVSAGSGKVFGWLANMIAVAGLLSWFGISVTYIRFYAGVKAQGLDRSKFPYSSKLQPYAAWYAAISCFIICLVRFFLLFMLLFIRFNDAIYMSQFSGWAVFLKDNWNTATFVTNYLPLIMFPIFYIGAKLWKRSSIVRASEMDFQSGLAEIEADTYDEPPPRNNWERFWQWLVCVSVFYIWADLNALY